MNPQTALAASIDHLRLPGLSRLSTIANAGLSQIQPDASRGRVRYLVLVTDSFSVFLAGKHTAVDLAGDLVEQVATGVMTNYKAVIYKPLWGKTLRILITRPNAIAELWEGIKHEPWSSTVEIDIAVAWLGNELVGERGLFLNPAYELWKKKHYQPHYAAGEWREIADRVCTSIGELASLRGRPEFAFHFREDSSQRKKLTEHIGHHMRVLIVEHIASKPEVPVLGQREDFHPGDLPARHWRRRSREESQQGQGRACHAGPLGP